MGDSLKGKTAIVVGSGQGIGRAIAIGMAQEGAKVLTNNRKPGSTGYAMVENKHKEGIGKDQCKWLDKEMDGIKGDAETTAQQIRDCGGEAASFFGDVSDFKVAGQLIEAALDNFGKIDILVNNAGYGLGGGIEEPSNEQIKTQYETNLFGVINMMREVLPHFRSQKSGHILNISSVVGFTAWPSTGFYSSTKFAMEALSEALSGELDHLGIKVTIVEPGGFRTDFAGRSFVKPENRIADYLSSERIDNIGDYHGAQMGDPVKGVKAIIDMVESENPPLRLPLGEDAVTAMEEKLAAVQKNIAEWRDISIDTKAEDEHAEGAGS